MVAGSGGLLGTRGTGEAGRDTSRASKIRRSSRQNPPVFPRVLGREGVGVVESVGEEVTDIKVGDLVIPAFVSECQECDNCLSGKTNLCLNYPLPLGGLMRDDTSRLSTQGQRLYHGLTCSTWSEYMVAEARYIVKIDPGISLSDASFISCGFSTGFGAAWKGAGVEKGATVAVIGLGAVGLGAMEGARAQGAAKIIGVYKNERKRTKGKAFGMTDFINPDEHSNKPISTLLKELTDGLGVFVFVYQSLTLVNGGEKGKGQTLVVGAGTQQTTEISFIPLLFGGNLKGFIFGGLKPKTDLPLIVAKRKNKEIQLEELLTHQVSLEDINKAFDLLKDPDCVKVLIKI
ncbi:Alcohol dehydrogenase-like 2 [Morella rubra]|uniref:Alcohol dehydrogenase-like 2 n=1 Tax=Morella rubra TaxID=262757 RepID=A0A6A1UYZ2_9ROSI|nr:Alcohol dehydrogenase-like 2 [Morella rubra]